MRALTVSVALATLSLGSAAPAQDREECASAVDEYKSAVSNIDYTLKRYVRCVGASAGRDDCSTEFRRLKGEQDSFESAVSDIEANCDQ